MTMSDKLKLTKNQSSHLENLMGTYSKKSIIEYYLNEPSVYDHMDGGINTLEFNDLMVAMYNGYEVEQTVEEKLLETYKRGLKLVDKEKEIAQTGAFQLGMQNALSIIGMKIKGITE